MGMSLIEVLSEDEKQSLLIRRLELDPAETLQ
jgi:hypothetical protein